MRSNNKFLVALSNLSLTPFIILVLLFAVVFQTDNSIEELNKRIDVLELHNSNHKSTIESMKEQIDHYELENNELKDKMASYEKDVNELPVNPIKEVVNKEVISKDLILLAQLIESESGNQDFEGKLAVGTVVMNRVASDDFPDTIREVIFQKGQFSVVPNGTINNEPSDESLKAAKEILEGKRIFGPKVLYFYNPKFTSKTNWIRSRTVSKTIDDHRFTI